MAFWLRWLLLSCLTFLTARAASAQTEDRATTSGLSVGVGFGKPSAGLGGHVYYYLQLPSDRWRLAAHAGVGVFGLVVFDGEAHVGVAGGVMGAFGRRHRLALDVFTAPLRTTGSTEERMELYYGVGALVGYEWMARYGLSVRTTLGVAYCPGNGGSFEPAGELVSLGYKFW
jgi:hypothetical protein